MQNKTLSTNCMYGLKIKIVLPLILSKLLSAFDKVVRGTLVARDAWFFFAPALTISS